MRNHLRHRTTVRYRRAVVAVFFGGVAAATLLLVHAMSSSLPTVHAITTGHVADSASDRSTGEATPRTSSRPSSRPSTAGPTFDSLTGSSAPTSAAVVKQSTTPRATRPRGELVRLVSNTGIALAFTWCSADAGRFVDVFDLEHTAAGAVSFRGAVADTYFGCDVTARQCDVDRVVNRSMESFWMKRRTHGRDRKAALSPVGSPEMCVVMTSCVARLAPCTGGAEEEWSVVPAASVDALRGELAASPPVRVVLVTTLKPFASMTVVQRSSAMNVLKNWSSLAQSIGVTVLVCVESQSDASEILSLGLGIHTDTTCETAQVSAATRRLPTYRGVFAAAEQLAVNRGAAWVMFSNADIMYTADQLDAVLVEVDHQRRAGAADDNWFVTGRRWNCDMSGSGVVDKSTCAIFGDDAQDYFLVNVGAFRWAPGAKRKYSLEDAAVVHGRSFRTFVEVPALVVGAIAFDNFIVAQANKRPDMHAIDATPALQALHLNHGGDVRASHHSVFSAWNSRLAHEHGGWARGKTSQLPFSLIRTYDGRARLHERYRVSSAEDCRIEHWNTRRDATDPPDAFSRPWVAPD